MLPFFENKQEKIFFACHSRIDFPAHLHNHVELYTVTHGAVDVLVDTQWHTVTPGALAVIFPGKVHAYRTQQEGAGRLFILPLSLVHAFKGALKTSQPVCPLLDAQQLTPRLRDNLCELEQAAVSTADDQTVAQALVQLILARLLALLPLAPRTAYDADGLLCHAIEAIGACYRGDLQLRQMAARLGVSEGHLSRTLGSGVGMGFCAYVNSLRVADAQNLLATTQLSVLEVALECGFQTLRSFNRAFLQHTGCTPSAYRRSRA